MSVWVRCFKYKYYGVKVVRCVVVFVICYFYKGVDIRKKIMEKFFVLYGVNISRLIDIRDRKRVYKEDR